MPRFIGFLVFIVLLVVLLMALFGARRPQRRGTYRPRQGWDDLFGAGRAGKRDAGLAHMVRRGELAGVRDGFSSAPIDPAQPLYRCASCQSFFHHDSIAVLARENRHRCSVCGSEDLGPVNVVD